MSEPRTSIGAENPGVHMGARRWYYEQRRERASLCDAHRAANYLSYQAEAKHWPRLQEIAGLILAMRAELESLRG